MLKPYIIIGKFKSPDLKKDKTAYEELWEFLSPNIQQRILDYKNKIPLEPY
jgi:hypothetical protein